MPRFESTILNDYFSDTNSHTHDGVNSTKIKYSDLTGKPGYASSTEAGLIKVGSNLSIDSNGVLSASTGVSNYNDLTNKPILNTDNTTALTVSSTEEIAGTISLHKISKTGNYNDLNNLPTIPTKTSELENDSGYITSTTEIDSKYLKGNGRISSADIPHIYTDNIVHQRLDIASASMTTNKPNGDGYINTFSWDNSGAWDTQMYYPNGPLINGGRPQIRFCNNKEDAWGSWNSLALYSDTTNKTNTSVFPNNSGHIKSKYRIGLRGYTADNIWYYPLCKFPAVSNNNSGSATIRGRIGGWQDSNMSSVYAMMWNRTTTGMTLLDLAGNLYEKTETIKDVWNICDIVIYKNSDNSDTVYLKCSGYFCFDLDLELFYDGMSILYDGTYVTTEPEGTLQTQASNATERMELYNDTLYVNDSKVLTENNINDNLTSTSTTDVLSANQGYILNNKKLESSNIKAGTNITLNVSGNDVTINSTGGGSGSEEVEIGDAEPTEDSIELWVDTSKDNTAEVFNLLVEYGNIPTTQMTNASIGGQAGKIYELTFKNTYTEIPTVVTTFNSQRSLSYYGFVSTQVVAISKTKCTLCLNVQSLNDSNAGISYTVMGK